MALAAPTQECARQNAEPFSLPGGAARRNGLPTKILEGTQRLGIYALLTLMAARHYFAPHPILRWLSVITISSGSSLLNLTKSPFAHDPQSGRRSWPRSTVYPFLTMAWRSPPRFGTPSGSRRALAASPSQGRIAHCRAWLAEGASEVL